MEKPLHITNGDSLTKRLTELQIEGTFLTWREILCEGPTTVEIGSDNFHEIRAEFLDAHYEAPRSFYLEKFTTPLRSYESFEAFDHVVLWFEYDLFCHINMVAAISWLQQKAVKLPLYLVCSGRVDGEDGLKGLSELTKGQLLQHYDDKILLQREDIDLATSIWSIYNSEDHNKLKQFVTRSSSFPYLSNCLSAQLKRFPSKHNGLNLLETHILNIISKETIRTKHQLVGYVLQYQGYYGFGDMQIEKIIAKLAPFYQEEDNRLLLNEDGEKALAKEGNYFSNMQEDTVLGGAKKYQFEYNITTKQLERRT